MTMIGSMVGRTIPGSWAHAGSMRVDVHVGGLIPSATQKRRILYP